MSERDSAALLSLGVRVAGLGLGLVDYIADTITLDARAAELFDLPAGSPIPRPQLHARIHAEDRLAVIHKVDALLAPEEPDVIDVVHRVPLPGGGHRWLKARKQVNFAPVGDDGKRSPVSGLVAIVDVTDLKFHEDRVVSLMGEMNHRLKNLLTVVQSIARMTARTTMPGQFLDAFLARLSALGRNQALLMTQSTEQTMMRDLLAQQLSAFTALGADRIDVSGPPLPLHETAVQTMGLAIHELATNATKYGALSVPDGRIGISWTIEAGTVVLDWVETGGPTVVPPERAGFGGSVLRAMIEGSLDATVVTDYRPEGLHWSMRAPAATLLERGPD